MGIVAKGRVVLAVPLTLRICRASGGQRLVCEGGIPEPCASQILPIPVLEHPEEDGIDVHFVLLSQVPDYALGGGVKRGRHDDQLVR